jgi:hypothetical protein
MPLPNITFIQSPNGLGRPLTGTDYISGHLHYYASGATLPTGFTSNDRIKKVFSVADAEALGITDGHLAETKAVAKYAVSTAGAAGDTVAITYTGIEGVETVLSTYTMVTADVVSTTTAAAALAAAINLGTATHGFSATNATNNLLITTKGGEGIFPNSGTPYAITIVGTVAGAWTQPTGAGSTVLGVASWIDTLHYHISEYFRIQPKGELYVGLYEEESTTYTFAAITTMQNFAQGAIKQIDIFEKNVVFSSAQATALQAIATANAAVYKPLQIVLNAEISGTASVATLTDLSTLTAPKVSVSIAQDGAGKGYHIYKATGKSVGIGGAMLGAISFASVSDSIAWIQKFNMASGGTELDTIAFANGQLYTALADSQFESLNNYAYVFLVKHIGITGSYFSDSKTTVISTSDYSTIENNRVYDKVTRVVRAALLPSLSGPLKVNADGTLNLDTIGFFESLANQPLIQMEADNELSAHKVIINPTQNVLSTSTLELTIQLVPIGVARFIEVNVGFVVSVA